MSDLNDNNELSLLPDNDSTKGRIINAALEEFSQFGLAGARVDRIARKAGINKAMIYYHFNSKDNLYREMIKSFFTNITRLIDHHLNITGTAVEVLAAISDIYTHLLSSHNPIRSILLRELANPENDIIGQIASVLMESQVSVKLRTILQEGVDSGKLRRIDIRQAVVSFLAMNIGYFTIYPITDRVLQIENRDQFIKERKEAVLDLFLNGIKAR